MKNRHSNFGSACLVLFALALGTLSTNWIQDAPVPTDHSQADAPTGTDSSSEGATDASAENVADANAVDENTLDENAAQFVQEPSKHSSYRPDFSSDRGFNRRRSNQRSNFIMLGAFREAISDTRKGTVQLLSEGQQISLGAIVAADGWIVTKASQLPETGQVDCRIYNSHQYVAKVVSVLNEIDLALLRIDESGLPTIRWDTSGIPNRGNWLATTDLRKTPSAVGVVSSGIQQIGKSKAVLGVRLVDSSEGAAITLVLPGSGADDAGLKIGDSIYQVNGREVYSRGEFLSVIANGYGGQPVHLGVNRADRKFDIDARLMDLSDELLDETEMEVNGRVSARATGFGRVFLHDTVLEPNQCGGPLVNLDGRVVGLNIARAGRVTSYALPADVVKPTVEGLIEQAKLVSSPVEPNSPAVRTIR